MTLRSAINMLPCRYVLGACIVCVGLAMLCAFALVWKPAYSSIPVPPILSFSPALITRGAQVASLGDCSTCHTAQGGKPYAGARPLPTPFGTIYSTNITPDAATGIGNWSEAAFVRTMRFGIDRTGNDLYPAMPYTHYNMVSDADLNALYAFLMTRSPIHSTARDNDLFFALKFRPLLAGWNLLFLHPAPYRPDASQSAEWNRGAYLVEGLGHCSACHSPLNLLGGEESGREFAGGSAEGWSAPPLDGTNPERQSWSVEGLYTYLRSGFATGHGAATGPMAPVVQNLASTPAPDVHAIAVYIYSIMAADNHPVSGAAPIGPTQPVDNEKSAETAFPLGAEIFAGACAGCHADDVEMSWQGSPSLAEMTDVQSDDPANVVHVILDGLTPPVNGRGPLMPSFAPSLSDADIADLANYVRARFSTRPIWRSVEKIVQAARKEEAQQ